MYPASVLRGINGTTVRCDVTLNSTDGYAQASHVPMSSFEWDPARIQIHVAQGQSQGLTGHQLRKELTGLPVLNACVLEFLMRKQRLIPVAWEGKHVAFWGSLYRSPQGLLCVRSMHREDCQARLWDWQYSYLDDLWFDDFGSAMLVGG